MKTIVAIVCLLSPFAAMTAVPDFITYSGRITDGSYDGLSAQATITFRLYGAAEGGTVLWEHEETVVVQDGYFSVMLGEGVDANDQSKVITVVFAEHGETWMELEVGGQVLAREAVGSVPYAARSERSSDSEKLEGVSLSVMEQRMYLFSAGVLCRVSTGESGLAAPIPEGESGSQACASRNRTCNHTVFLHLSDDKKAISWDENNNQNNCSALSPGSPWYACCSYSEQ